MNRYSHLELRCPRLGGEITFAYCEREGGDIPCPQIINCWQAFFPVETWLKEHLSQEAWERFTGHVPRDKVTTLVDLIEAAKKRAKRNDQE